MKTITTKLATYTIEPHQQRRVTEFVGGAPVWTTYIQYNILRDGKMVRFCYDENDIEEMIRVEENGHGIDAAYLTGVTAG
tara:strand:+ start:1128 stop:1367 length:240 start_codon:yes stop_codon:yes gene_type:complete